MLLLCTKHVEDNVRKSLPNVLSEKKKEEILPEIRGIKVVKGLIDTFDIDEFNAKLANLYTCEIVKKIFPHLKDTFNVIKKTISVTM